jgi:hypothetical protein
MTNKLRKRLNKNNKIIFLTLKPRTVTTALKI